MLVNVDKLKNYLKTITNNFQQEINKKQQNNKITKQPNNNAIGSDNIRNH